MNTLTDAIEITIDGLPAYPLSPNARNHWGVRRKASETAGWAVKAAISETRPSIDCPVALAWTVYLDRGGRKRDQDNMLACLKAHTDALVREGVIPGDSPRWIPTTPTVEQVLWSRHKGEARIVVRITPV